MIALDVDLAIVAALAAHAGCVKRLADNPTEIEFPTGGADRGCRASPARAGNYGAAQVVKSAPLWGCLSTQAGAGRRPEPDEGQAKWH